jgi:hypothetical protein
MSRAPFLSPTAALAVLASTCAAGAIDLTIQGVPDSMRYGTRTSLYARVVDDAPCATQRSLAVKVDGRPVRSPRLEGFDATACGSSPRGASASIAELAFGTHTIDAEYRHADQLVATARTQVTVTPQFEASLPAGGSLKLALADPGNPLSVGTCDVNARIGAYGMPGWPAEPPPLAIAQSALFSLETRNCSWRGANTGFQGPGPDPGPLAQRVLVERDVELPLGTVAWAYGPTSGDSRPHWYELGTGVSGRGAVFELVDGAAGDDSLAKDGQLRATIALAVPKYSAVAGRFQDLWWAGPSENGWGVAITQHREMLFATLFVYDDAGDARWFVMPSGRWSADGTAFTGDLFRPRSPQSSIGPYDPSRFDIGAPIGTLRLIPSSSDAIRMEYTVDGVSGAKALTRIPFGPVDAAPAVRRDDLWWEGPSKNGTGIVIAQQHRTLFALEFAYDALGEPAWHVTPSLQVNDDSSWYGERYRPFGSPPLTRAYDASRHRLEKAGTFFWCVRDATKACAAGGTVLYERIPF